MSASLGSAGLQIDAALVAETQSLMDAVAAERERLTKELEKIGKAIQGTRARLANESFTAKAPPAVVEGARKQLAENESRRDEIRRLLESLDA